MTFKVTTEDSNNDFVGRNKCKAMELRRDSLKASFERVCVYTQVCFYVLCTVFQSCLPNMFPERMWRD